MTAPAASGACPACGTLNSHAALTCNLCGAVLPWAVKAPPPQPVAPSVAPPGMTQPPMTPGFGPPAAPPKSALNRDIGPQVMKVIGALMIVTGSIGLIGIGMNLMRGNPNIRGGGAALFWIAIGVGLWNKGSNP